MTAPQITKETSRPEKQRRATGTADFRPTGGVEVIPEEAYQPSKEPKNHSRRGIGPSTAIAVMIQKLHM